MPKTRNSTHSKNALGKVGQSYKEAHVNSNEKKSKSKNGNELINSKVCEKPFLRFPIV